MSEYGEWTGWQGRTDPAPEIAPMPPEGRSELCEPIRGWAYFAPWLVRTALVLVLVSGGGGLWLVMDAGWVGKALGVVLLAVAAGMGYLLCCRYLPEEMGDEGVAD